MIGFNKSPNITIFAEKHNVPREGVVSAIKDLFGDNLYLLKYAHADMVGDKLRFSSRGFSLFFDTDDATDDNVELFTLIPGSDKVLIVQLPEHTKIPLN